MLKAKYFHIYNIVKKSIDKWDAIGLLEMGAPNDEYYMEIEQIVPIVYRDCNLEELAEQISKTFTEYFGIDTFKATKTEIQSVAEEILKLKSEVNCLQ